jgi:hypothetical protein
VGAPQSSRRRPAHTARAAALRCARSARDPAAAKSQTANARAQLHCRAMAAECGGRCRGSTCASQAAAAAAAAASIRCRALSGSRNTQLRCGAARSHSPVCTVQQQSHHCEHCRARAAQLPVSLVPGPAPCRRAAQSGCATCAASGDSDW